MADLKLSATTRTEFGKGAARRIRRAGDVPAVLYGHGTDPVHITLPGQETFLALRSANVLLEIAIEGTKKPVMALPKQVQRDVLTHFIEHVDLLIVKAGEKVTVEVALVLTGEAQRDGLVNHDLTSLTVEAPATNIPAEIEVPIDDMAVGDSITVADLKLPEGVETSVDPEQLVLNVVPAPVADLTVPGEDDETAEPEVVGEESDEEEE